MKVAKWTIKTYNAALKAIRKRHPKLSLARARATYRKLSAKSDKNVSSATVRNLSRAELDKAVRNSRVKPRPKEQKKSRFKLTIAPVRFEKAIRTLKEYSQVIQSGTRTDRIKLGAGVDTGRKRPRRVSDEPKVKRCRAKTHDGKRCKRMAEENGVYCWQHKKEFEWIDRLEDLALRPD